MYTYIYIHIYIYIYIYPYPYPYWRLDTASSCSRIQTAENPRRDGRGLPFAQGSIVPQKHLSGQLELKPHIARFLKNGESPTRMLSCV